MLTIEKRLAKCRFYLEKEPKINLLYNIIDSYESNLLAFEKIYSDLNLSIKEFKALSRGLRGMPNYGHNGNPVSDREERFYNLGFKLIFYENDERI